jgi:beta-lactamase class A
MKKYLGLILVVFVSFTGGYFYPKKSTTPLEIVQKLSGNIPIRQKSQYQHINPLLECENTGGIENGSELSTLKTKLETQIGQITSANEVSHVAIYFRDLNNGPWFGINENSNFTPASLLKTPIMIAYLKQAEGDPSILTKKLIFDPSKNPPDSPAPNIPSMKPNATYSIEELISRMITYSDNNAFNLLTLNLDYQLVAQVHADLGITIPDESTPEDFVTVKQYAGLFRVLFNSSYLSRPMSEKALDILARASYHDGIVSGVDDGVEIAHKYGVRGGDSSVNQLHDCGIVYYPDHPYLVCVMTKGENFKTLASTISSLSRTIYDEIKSRYPLQ